MSDITFRSDIPVRLMQHCGGDASVVAAARVSTEGADSVRHIDADPEGAKGLIRYLIKMKHGTPFEHASMTFAVTAPIFVWREWHRHRIGFSYNEESGRYKTLDPVFYLPARDRPMVKVDGWKPGRPKFRTLDEHVADQFGDGLPPNAAAFVKDRADALYADIVADMKAGYADEYARYLRQLGRDLDPGLARDNLPVGIYSSCWVTCNPRSLMAFLSLRTHEPTAKHVSYPLHEIDVAARQCEAEFARLFPITYEAFQEFGRVSP